MDAFLCNTNRGPTSLWTGADPKKPFVRNAGITQSHIAHTQSTSQTHATQGDQVSGLTSRTNPNLFSEIILGKIYPRPVHLTSGTNQTGMKNGELKEVIKSCGDPLRQLEPTIDLVARARILRAPLTEMLAVVMQHVVSTLMEPRARPFDDFDTRER